MKLDRIKFASLTAYIVGLRPEYDIDLYQLDTLTELPDQTVQYSAVEKVDDLLMYVNREGGFIEAIRAYRALTGAGLKEGKEAIEKYRKVICTKVAS